MVSPGEISLLCRLCLVKDQVNVPIFGEQGDIRQIFLKISSCLPVTVSKEDQLPKNICEGCSDKLDLLFAFWNSSRDAEKTLVSWLKQASVDNANETINAIAKQISAKPVAEVKQETDDGQNIKIQQSSEEGKNDESEEAPPPPKRARRTAAVKAQISISQEDESEEEEDDVDAVEPLTKVEDESDMSDNDGADNQPLSSFVDMPGTSADDQEQAGPSGVGKDGGADAPEELHQEESIKIEFYYESDEEDIEVDYTSDVPEAFNDSNTKKHAFDYNIEENYLDSILYEEPVKTKDCTICKTSFYNYSHLYDHLTSVHFKRVTHGKIICSVCSYVVPTIRQGLIHYNNIHDKTVLGCHICGKTFQNTSLLRRHISGTHSTEADKVCCDICGIVLKNQLTLDIHRKQQHQKGPPQLEVCQRCGFKVNSLPMHMLKIHGDSDLKCDECGKLFASQKGLSIHVKLHTNQKPFQCQYCGKAFMLNSMLHTHLRRHPESGVEPFECRECGRKFSRRSTWADHMSRHNGRKPYECEVCHKKFGIKRSLYSHRKLKHPEAIC